MPRTKRRVARVRREGAREMAGLLAWLSRNRVCEFAAATSPDGKHSLGAFGEVTGGKTMTVAREIWRRIDPGKGALVTWCHNAPAASKKRPGEILWLNCRGFAALKEGAVA